MGPPPPSFSVCLLSLQLSLSLSLPFSLFVVPPRSAKCKHTDQVQKTKFITLKHGVEQFTGPWGQDAYVHTYHLLTLHCTSGAPTSSSTLAEPFSDHFPVWVCMPCSVLRCQRNNKAMSRYHTQRVEVSVGASLLGSSIIAHLFIFIAHLCFSMELFDIIRPFNTLMQTGERAGEVTVA